MKNKLLTIALTAACCLTYIACDDNKDEFWMNSAPFYPSETVMRLKWKYIIQVKTENTS